MKILGYNYTIVEEGDSELIGAFGRFHAKSQKLQLAEELCEEQKVSTIFHEILEAINYHLDFSLEHRTIMGIEAALYQALVDNGVDLSPLLGHITRASNTACTNDPASHRGNAGANVKSTGANDVSDNNPAGL